MLKLENIREYDAAAEWCARHGLKGKPGDALPMLMSKATVDAINEDTDAFAERVRECAYALAMERDAEARNRVDLPHELD